MKILTTILIASITLTSTCLAKYKGIISEPTTGEIMKNGQKIGQIQLPKGREVIVERVINGKSIITVGPTEMLVDTRMIELQKEEPKEKPQVQTPPPPAPAPIQEQKQNTGQKENKDAQRMISDPTGKTTTTKPEEEKPIHPTDSKTDVPNSTETGSEKQKMLILTDGDVGADKLYILKDEPWLDVKQYSLWDHDRAYFRQIIKDWKPDWVFINVTIPGDFHVRAQNIFPRFDESRARMPQIYGQGIIPSKGWILQIHRVMEKETGNKSVHAEIGENWVVKTDEERIRKYFSRREVASVASYVRRFDKLMKDLAKFDLVKFVDVGDPVTNIYKNGICINAAGVSPEKIYEVIKNEMLTYERKE